MMTKWCGVWKRRREAEIEVEIKENEKGVESLCFDRTSKFFGDTGAAACFAMVSCVFYDRVVV